MSKKTDTFATLDRENGIAPLPERHGEEMPLPAWYRTVYHTPLEELTIEDLCKASRQQLHIEQIIPIALARLREEPMAGEMFDGELLVSLRSVGVDYWVVHRSNAAALKAIIDAAWSNLPEDIQFDARDILARLSLDKM